MKRLNYPLLMVAVVGLVFLWYTRSRRRGDAPGAAPPSDVPAQRPGDRGWLSGARQSPAAAGTALLQVTRVEPAGMVVYGKADEW